MAPVFSVRSVDMPGGSGRFETIFNHCQLNSVALTYARYGSPVQLRLSQNDFFVQGFPLAGAGEVQWNRHSTLVQSVAGGIAGGPGADAVLTYGAGFEHVIFKTTPKSISQKLSALIGVPVDPPLRLAERITGRSPHTATLYRLISFLIDELDLGDGDIAPIVVAELEQAILVNYLLANENNYSHLLHGTPRAAAPWQVRRAVDYIEAHWDMPITIETLSEVSHATARSLFYLFRRTYGISPMIYANRVRMRHAKHMLSNPTPETNVTSVGFMCGFSNLGHFSKKYHDAFGEKPSDTLRTYR
ncbi:MAG: AraC family transcriptional regulator [Rhizobiaceae bacterium]|nr:AraC family transcriptional regulator [Rhizobiaceae bacterium]